MGPQLIASLTTEIDGSWQKLPEFRRLPPPTGDKCQLAEGIEFPPGPNELWVHFG